MVETKTTKATKPKKTTKPRLHQKQEGESYFKKRLNKYQPIKQKSNAPITFRAPKKIPKAISPFKKKVEKLHGIS